MNRLLLPFRVWWEELRTPGGFWWPILAGLSVLVVVLSVVLIVESVR